MSTATRRMEQAMDDHAVLASQAAEALLKAIRDAAPKSLSTAGVLHLAQAYALVVGAEAGDSSTPIPGVDAG